MAQNGENVRPIVIKKVIKKSGAGHHGGAWKVAYADFTTAMMAFFMLLWLLNISTQEQLEGIADYFTPTSASVVSESGSGQILAGTAPIEDGSQSSGAVAVSMPPATPTPGNTADNADAEGASTRDQFDSTINRIEDAQLIEAAEQIRMAIQTSPELAQYQDQLVVEQTPEGMRIQILDKDRRSMFRDGSADLFQYAEQMIETVGDIVEDLPNRVALLGHTDGQHTGRTDGYSNWELSADRANAARRVLDRTGVTTDRFSEVTGKADTEPMYPDSPQRPENRRITILVLREAPVLDPDFGEN